MKIVRFTSSGYPSGAYGIVNEGRLQIIKGSPIDNIERTGDEVKIDDIKSYLPPVDPPNVLAIGLNYHNHAAEFESVPPTEPLVFIKATSSITAHEEPILIPAIAPSNVDYEAELVAIIGKTARNVSESDALNYVLGYTCGNDVTARDCQAKDGQWARAKSFDTFAPIGPWIETELDPTDVNVRMKLNGEIMQDQNTSDLIFGIPQLISHLSKCMTLRPGTIIFSGTPGGVGFTRKPPVFLKPGDICEVEIEGIGTLRNTVAESRD